VKTKGKLSPQVSKVANEVKNRILKTVQPERILLFGSGANGKLTANSDLDLLVVVNGPVHRRRLAQKITRNLRGVGMPVDIIVVTNEDVTQYGQRIGTILRPALREGRVLYAR
jgi:predicted nucleotidyltransferase